VWEELARDLKPNQNKTEHIFKKENITAVHWFGTAVNSIYTCINENIEYALSQKWLRRKGRREKQIYTFQSSWTIGIF